MLYRHITMKWIGGVKVKGPIDTHVHLDMLPDVDKAIEAAGKRGVSAVVGVGMNLESNRRILEIAAKHPEMVRPALGAHPWAVDENWPDNISFIESSLAGAVALGEVGLDYKVKVKKELQHRVLNEGLRLAADKNKPVLLHARYSQERCLKMLREAGIERAVFHWYSGPLDMLKKIIKAGYHVSATPALAYSPPHRAALSEAPLDSILVETDAPEEYQGKASKPADVFSTIELLAELRGLELEEAVRATLENAMEFFGWR